ncbi:thioesterase family protein [Mesorhizobium sp. WSM4313]|uniref:thioesterase family protein n=1 Tax=Mesorhizobium sp. WSM4313 TaxID=2029412 RepID=UPI001AECC9AC|nr:thioesterase family protein [Mesorhizobium sp. WSM4313]
MRVLARGATVTSDLKPGLRRRQILRVDDTLTVPAMTPAFAGFGDMPPVFATAFMVGFIEWACIEALRPFLGSPERTVGTHVDVSHVAATPVGMMVTADVELVAVKGRKLRFKVSCTDEGGLIGEGLHERAVIDHDKFMARVLTKSGQTGSLS